MSKNVKSILKAMVGFSPEEIVEFIAGVADIGEEWGETAGERIGSSIGSVERVMETLTALDDEEKNNLLLCLLGVSWLPKLCVARQQINFSVVYEGLPVEKVGGIRDKLINAAKDDGDTARFFTGILTMSAEPNLRGES